MKDSFNYSRRMMSNEKNDERLNTNYVERKVLLNSVNFAAELQI